MSGTIRVPVELLSGIAEWPTPNYVDPVRRTWLPAFMLVWLLAATMLLGGRFYLRARKLAGGFGFDDLLIGLGWFCSIAMTACIWTDVVRYGIDRHVWDMKLEWAVGAVLYGWLGQVFFIAGTVCTKLSVLLFNRRMIKETVDVRWLWALRFAFAFTSLYGLGALLAYLLSCQPTEALWLAYSGTYDQDFKCVDASSVAVSVGALSVISDLFAVLLPCLMLNHYNLDISRRQKIVLNLTFGLGLIATGAGIARSYYLWKVQHTADPTWVGAELSTWTVVECQLSIICACAPSLRAFFRRYLLETIKRSFSSGCSHYAHGSRCKGSLHTSGTTVSQHGCRGFKELKELESGVHGIAYPPPVILGEEHGDAICMNPSAAVSRRTTLQGEPKVTTPDEYECFVNERLSRHGTLVKERQSRTESILGQIDGPVGKASVGEGTALQPIESRSGSMTGNAM